MTESAAEPGDARPASGSAAPEVVAEGGPVADADRRWRTRHLPTLLAVSAALAALAAVVGAVLAGVTGALGAAGGVLMVTLGYLGSTLVIARADAVNPRLVLPVGLGAYVVKVSVLAGVLLVLAATDWAGLVPFSLGVVAGVVGWTGAHIWWITAVHARR